MTGEVAIFELKTLLNILVALALGFCIGFERKLRSKEAGIRTHTIVCIGAALMMIVSKYGFSDTEGADPARLAAQIISGVGFLGAGMIVYRQHEVRGLTTAAGVWATAGVGMAAGAGMYIVAAGATVIMITVQCFLHAPWKIFNTKKSYRLNITFRHTDGEDAIIKEVFKIKHFYSFRVKDDKQGNICEVSIFTDQEYRSEELLEIRNSHPFICSIERIDDF